MQLISLFPVLDPHQRCLQAKVKYLNEPKQVMPKSEDLSMSLEKNKQTNKTKQNKKQKTTQKQFGHLIRSFQLFSIYHAHILLSSLQLNTDN